MKNHHPAVRAMRITTMAIHNHFPAPPLESVPVSSTSRIGSTTAGAAAGFSGGVSGEGSGDGAGGSEGGPSDDGPDDLELDLRVSALTDLGTSRGDGERMVLELGVRDLIGACRGR